jgi:hypothetical protein
LLARYVLNFTYCSVLHPRRVAGLSFAPGPQLALHIVLKILFSEFFLFYAVSFIFFNYLLWFLRANVYSFVLMGTQHRKGVAFGVTSGPTNRIPVTKASRRGVAT